MIKTRQSLVFIIIYMTRVLLSMQNDPSCLILYIHVRDKIASPQYTIRDKIASPQYTIRDKIAWCSPEIASTNYTCT